MFVPEGQNPSALIRHAIELHKSRRFRDALQLYQQVLLMCPESVEALTYSGVALLEIGKAKEAAKRLRAAVDAKPDCADARGYLGNALQLTGELDEAEAAFRGALELAPANARSHNNLGVLLLKRDRPEEAVASFNSAVSINPCYAEAHNNLCQAYLKLGENEEAIRAGEKAIENNSRYAQGHNNYGNALAEVGRYEEAIAAYRKAIAIRPNFVDALNNLAVALIVEGQASEALEITEACFEVDPGNVTALATKSVALSEKGENEAQEALVDFDRLLQKIHVDPGPNYESLAAFNEALARHVCSHPTLTFAPADHATRKGKHSGDLLAEPKGPISDLERIIADAFDRYVQALPANFEHPFLVRKPDQWELDIWALVLDSEGHQVPHIHPSGWLSGCYYVQVSEAVSGQDEGHQGWIEFGRPQSIYHATIEPRLELVRPEEGLMVLFPSFHFHRTIPFEAPAKRICIAFDICPRD